MNYDSDIFKCPICLDQYNLTDRLPKMLPQCGHTICLECLSTLLRNSDPKCPLDKVCFVETHVELDQYPTNFSLRNLMEEDNHFDICPKHNARVEVVCFNEKVKLCPYCALFSEHKDHELRYLADIQDEVAAKKKEVDAVLKTRGDYQKETEKAIEDKKQELLKIIEDRYEELFSSLRAKKEALTNHFNIFFDQQKGRINEYFERDALVQSTLTAKSIGFRDFAKKKDPFSVLDEDISQLIPRLDTASIQKPIQRLQEQLNEVAIYLNTILAVKPASLEQFDTPVTAFAEKSAAILAESLKEDFLMQPAQIGDLPFFEVLGSFKVDTSDNVFKMTAHNKLAENTSVDVEAWKNIKEAVITLEQFAFSQKDLTWFTTMWNLLENLTSIKVIAPHQTGMTDINLSKLFTILFMRSEKLESISIDLESSKVGNESIRFVLEEIMPKAVNLKHISLSLVKTGVTDSTIEAFTRKVLSKCKELETFSVDLGLTGVTENVISQMFIEMPNVKKFLIGLNGLNISNATLETLTKNTVATMTALEDFEMKLWMSKVNDDSLSKLFNEIKDTKRLALNLVGTSVTDKSMNVLVNSISERMKSLKQLELLLWSTPVSEAVKNQLDLIVKARAN